MRRVAYLLGAATLAASGAYVLIYLYRWEWNRALISAAFFLATQIALVTAVILNRLRRLDEKLEIIGSNSADPQVLERIRESAPQRRHFAWLREVEETSNVFVPILMGTGIVLSGLAWLVERIARATAQPVLERKLAARLAPLTVPPGNLMGRASDEVGGIIDLSGR